MNVGNVALTSPTRIELASAERPQGRIEAAARGDRAAAQELALELLPRVRNLVRYLTRSSDIDDVTQEALVTVLHSLPSYRPTGSFQAWVDRVVVRATFAQLQVEEDVAAPHDVAGAYATRTRIAAALDALPVEQRFTVVLHHVLGMSAAEVAEEMDVPLETARSRLRLGMQHLRRQMDAKEGDSR